MRLIDDIFPDTWRKQLNDEFSKTYFIDLMDFLTQEYASKTVFPEKKNLFNAFQFFDFADTKVIIIGQDPYHGVGQAHGLAFSVPDNQKIPPSLRNIFKELERDFGYSPPKSGDLTTWAQQGVLLINAIFSVEAHKAGSHRKKGWETFTDAVILQLSERLNNLVFILWGNFAQEKENLIDSRKHCILKSVHPSPLSAHKGFIGNCHFSETNKYLEKNNKTPINWELKNKETQYSLF